MTHLHEKKSWEKQIRKGVNIQKNHGACKPEMSIADEKPPLPHRDGL
jgi:hypothetical protein